MSLIMVLFLLNFAINTFYSINEQKKSYLIVGISIKNSNFAVRNLVNISNNLKLYYYGLRY